MTVCCLTEHLAMSKSTRLSAKLKSFRPHAPLSTPPHTPPILSLDIPSPSLLSNNPSNDLTGEDVHLDPPDLSHRPISPWVDLGQRSSHPSHLLLSAQNRLTDAGRRRTQYVIFTPAQLSQILNLAAPIIRERGLETLGLFRPWRFSESPYQIARLQLLLIDYLLPSPPSSSLANQPSSSVSLDDIRDQMVFTLIHDLVHVLKWSIRHLSYQPSHFALSSSWYTTFNQLERDKSFPLNAYVSILLPLLPLTSQQLLTAVLDLVAAVAAHADQNAMPASYLCKLLGFWILGFGSESFVSYDQLYFEWDRAGRAFEHVFLAYLRSQTGKLPKRLKELISLYYPSGSTKQGGFCPRFTTKSIKVLKVQIETSSLTDPFKKLDSTQPSLHQEHPRVASPTPSSTIKRGPSIRSRTRPRSRRSVSISTARPSSLPPPPLPPTHRNTLEILKSASLAHPAPDLSSTHYPLWKSLLDCARAEDRHQLLLASSLGPSNKDLSAVKDVIGLLDDETIRVISLTLVPSPSDHALMRNKPRSFSFDVPSSPSGPPPPHAKPAAAGLAAHLLGTLHEDHKNLTTSSLLTPSIAPSIASNPTTPTASWADFVASGFAPAATSAPVLSPPGSALGNVPAAAVIPSRTSLSTVRSAPAYALTPKKSRTGHHKHKPPVTRSQRPARLVSDDHAAPAPVTQLSEQQPDRTVRSVNVVSVDESFPDVWIDTVGEPMILSRWPSFFISPIALPPKPNSTGENSADQPEGFAAGSSNTHSASGRDTAGMPSHLLVDEVLVGGQGIDQSHQPYEQVQIARQDLPSVTPNDRDEMAFVQVWPGQDSGLPLQGQLPSSNDNNDDPVSHAQSLSAPIPPSTSTAPAAAKSNKVVLAFSTFGRNSKRRISSFFANYQSASGLVTDDEDSHIVKKKKKKKDKKWLANFSIPREGSGMKSATAVKAPAVAPATAVVDQESGNRIEEEQHEAQQPAAVNDDEGPSQPQLDKAPEVTAAQGSEGEESTVIVDEKRETGHSEVAHGGALADPATQQPSSGPLTAGDEKIDEKVEIEGMHRPMENMAEILSNLQDERVGDHVVKEGDDERETGRSTPSDIPMINPVDPTEHSVGLEDPPSLIQRQEQQQVLSVPVAVADLIHDELEDAQRLRITPTSGFREHLDLENRRSVVEGSGFPPGEPSEGLSQALSSECEDGPILSEQAHGSLSRVEETADVKQEGRGNVEAALGGGVDCLPVEASADEKSGQKDSNNVLNEPETAKMSDTVVSSVKPHLPYQFLSVDSENSKKETEVEGQDCPPLNLSEEGVAILGVEAEAEDDTQLGETPEVVNEGPVTVIIEPVAPSRGETPERVVDGPAIVEIEPNVSGAHEVPVTMSVDISKIAVGSDLRASVGHDSTMVASEQDSKLKINSLSSISFAKSNGGEGEISSPTQRIWRTRSSASQASKTSSSSNGDPTSPVSPSLSSRRRSILSKANLNKLKSFSRSRKGSNDSAVVTTTTTTIGTVDTSLVPLITSALEPTVEEEDALQQQHGISMGPLLLSSSSIISVEGLKNDNNTGEEEV